MPVHLRANFPCYYGNGVKWGQPGLTKKFVDPFHYTFYNILWQNIIPSWPNGAQKSAYPYCSVTMATFSNFRDFSSDAYPRAFFLPNIKSLSVTIARQSRELRIWWKRAIYKLIFQCSRLLPSPPEDNQILPPCNYCHHPCWWEILSQSSIKGTSRGPEALQSPQNDSCYKIVLCFP